MVSLLLLLKSIRFFIIRSKYYYEKIIINDTGATYS